MTQHETAQQAADRADRAAKGSRSTKAREYAKLAQVHANNVLRFEASYAGEPGLAALVADANKHAKALADAAEGAAAAYPKRR